MGEILKMFYETGAYERLRVISHTYRVNVDSTGNATVMFDRTIRVHIVYDDWTEKENRIRSIA